MLEDVDLSGADHGPADGLVRLLDGRLLVARAQQPPGREHARLPAPRHPQARRPATADELLSVLRRDPPRDVAARRVLQTLLGPVEAGPRFTEVDHAQLERAVADLTRAVLALADVALILVVHPQQLVLPVEVIEAIEVVEEVRFPACGRGLRRNAGGCGQRQ